MPHTCVEAAANPGTSLFPFPPTAVHQYHSFFSIHFHNDVIFAHDIFAHCLRGERTTPPRKRALMDMFDNQPFTDSTNLKVTGFKLVRLFHMNEELEKFAGGWFVGGGVGAGAVGAGAVRAGAAACGTAAFGGAAGAGAACGGSACRTFTFRSVRDASLFRLFRLRLFRSVRNASLLCLFRLRLFSGVRDA